jgi:hypothetical protein
MRPLPPGLGPPPSIQSVIDSDTATGTASRDRNPPDLEQYEGRVMQIPSGDGRQVTKLTPPGSATTVTRNGPITVTTGAGGMVSEPGVSRPGSDYRDFELAANAGPEACQRSCEAEARVCRAFTYVRAGVRGAQPHCFLKNDVPEARPDPCCVSGFVSDVDVDALQRALPRR